MLLKPDLDFPCIIVEHNCGGNTALTHHCNIAWIYCNHPFRTLLTGCLEAPLTKAWPRGGLASVLQYFFL